MERNGGAAEIELTGSDLVAIDEGRAERTASITINELPLETDDDGVEPTIPTVPAVDDAEEELSEAELIPLDEYRAKKALRELERSVPLDEELTRPNASLPVRPTPPSTPPPAPRREVPPPSFPPLPLPPPPAPRASAPRTFPPPPPLAPAPLPVSRAPSSASRIPIPSIPAPTPLPLPAPIPAPASIPSSRLPTPFPRAHRTPIRIPIPQSHRPQPQVTVPTTAIDAPSHELARPRRRNVGELWTFVVGIAALATIATAVALVINALRSPDAAQPRQGSAVVVTVAGPSGTAVPNAVVFANNRPWCDTAPCRLEGLEPGVHLVHVTAPGFVRAAQRAVSVGGNEDRTLHFELVPQNSAATGAATSVSIDELPAESAATADAPETRAQPSQQRAAPAPVAARPGVLNLGSTPRASVVVDGRPLGLTPQRVRVSPGPHSVLFVHPELGRVSRSVNVASGGNHTVAVQLGE